MRRWRKKEENNINNGNNVAKIFYDYTVAVDWLENHQRVSRNGMWRRKAAISMKINGVMA